MPRLAASLGFAPFCLQGYARFGVAAASMQDRGDPGKKSLEQQLVQSCNRKLLRHGYILKGHNQVQAGIRSHHSSKSLPAMEKINETDGEAETEDGGNTKKQDNSE